MGRNVVFAGRGVLAWFLHALPASTLGHRKIGADPVPPHVSEEYAAQVDALARTLAGWTDPAVLPLTPEAGKVLLDFEPRLEPRLAAAGDLQQLADWAAKLAGTTIRVAGLVHLAALTAPIAVRQPITAATMVGTVQVADYLTAHALAAFDVVGADPVLDDARAVLDHLAARRVEQFTRRDLFTSLSRSKFRTVAALDPVLALLAEHGWITQQDSPQPDGPGRPPSPTFVTRLRTYTHNPRNPQKPSRQPIPRVLRVTRPAHGVRREQRHLRGPGRDRLRRRPPVPMPTRPSRPLDRQGRETAARNARARRCHQPDQRLVPKTCQSGATVAGSPVHCDRV